MRSEYKSGAGMASAQFGRPSHEARSVATVNVAPAETPITNIVVIESRTLFRECLTRCIETVFGPWVIAFPSVQNWEEVMDQTSVRVIVLSAGGRSRSAETVQRDIALLKRIANQVPMIVLADAEEPSQVVEALEQGVRGYIPTSVSLGIAVEAMRLVGAGGVYVPADCLLISHRTGTSASPQKQPRSGVFTERQTAVLDALRRGKANKIIAYELNMRESTVKVHVRNIMKKLRASNRTEAAYMAHTLMNQDGELDTSLVRAAG